MSVVINAANAYAGGGVTLAANFLSWLSGSEIEAVAIVPDLPIFRGLRWSARLQPRFVPAFSLGGWRRVWFDHVALPRLCYQLAATHLLTLGSIGPIRVPCAHAVLVQNSYYVYDRCEARRRLPWRLRARLPIETFLFRRCIRAADAVIVQSETIAARLSKSLALPPSRMHIVGNGVNLALLQPRPAVHSRYFRLLTVARYYTHKNLELLIEIGTRMVRANPPVRFLITVSSDDGVQARKWLADLASHGIADLFDNRGRVPYADLPRLYAQADCVLYPTLLESSTAAYAEAMHFGLPIITSDLDFAHDACGQAALYCDPLRPDPWVHAIRQLASDPTHRAELVAAGRDRLRQRAFSWDQLAPKLAAAAGFFAPSAVAATPSERS